MENRQEARRHHEGTLPIHMSEYAGLYDIRDAKIGDKAFILATFLRGLYYGDSWFSQVPKDIFMANYKLVAEKLVTSPRSIVKIACLKEDPDIIIGYSILSGDYSSVHWVYVKEKFRKRGVAKSLLPKYPTAVTHLTVLGKSLLNKFETPPIFNPFKV
jgi:GNAT superfamily N-acetyltransferase